MPNLPHNKMGLLSLFIFAGTFGTWMAIVAIFGDSLMQQSRLGVDDVDYMYIIDLISLLPYSIGLLIGIKASLNKQTNPTFPFAGLALNGVMAFKIFYAAIGLSL